MNACSIPTTRQLTFADLFPVKEIPSCTAPCYPTVCDDCPCPGEELEPCTGSEINGVCDDCDSKTACESHDPRCNGCESFDSCKTHNPEIQECVAKALMMPKKPTKEDKIPYIGWCTQRACQELDWEGGICITTGKPIKEMTYCPTQHQVKPGKKPRSSTRTKALVAKAFTECRDPIRKFLNEHQDQIITGKDLPIVPHVVEEYKRFDETCPRSLKLYITFVSSPITGPWWSLAPSGKLRKVKAPIGKLHQGQAFPDCKFRFEWYYYDKKKECEA